MKPVKTIGIVLVSLVGLFLVAEALLPKTAHIEHSIYIKAPLETVFEQVNNLNNWKKWSVWMADTTVTVTYGAVTSGTGATYSWSGEKMGQGELKIAESNPPTNIKIDLDFKEHGTAKAEWKFEQVADSVKATESYDSELPFAKRLFFMLMIKSHVDQAFETDLKGLKTESEKAPAPASATAAIEQVDVPAQWVIAVRDTAKEAELNAAFGTDYTAVMTYLSSKKLNPTGPSLAVWYGYDHAKDFYDFEAGFPIADSIAAGKGLRVFKLGGGKAIKTTHMGDYSKMKATYDAVDAYKAKNSLTTKVPSWEVYGANPMTEKDTAKWQTDIYFPL